MRVDLIHAVGYSGKRQKRVTASSPRPLREQLPYHIAVWATAEPMCGEKMEKKTIIRDVLIRLADTHALGVPLCKSCRRKLGRLF